jgi:Na+-transporting methylmalonyl-CoA/oxaloacetate decarboxylase gamma subunit
VTPPYLPRGEGSMDAIGWTIFLGIVVLFLPLLPVVVIVWLISKAVGALAGRATVDTDDADLE